MAQTVIPKNQHHASSHKSPNLQPAPEGSITCKTDAAWDESTKRAGLAWILSDS